jgi:hypothetical protein
MRIRLRRIKPWARPIIFLASVVVAIILYALSPALVLIAVAGLIADRTKVKKGKNYLRKRGNK